MLKNIGKILFNSARVAALTTGDYFCPNCGEKMIWEDEDLGFLVCENCGESMDSDEYGLSEDERDELYGTVEHKEYEPDEYDVIGGFNGFDGPFDQ